MLVSPANAGLALPMLQFCSAIVPVVLMACLGSLGIGRDRVPVTPVGPAPQSGPLAEADPPAREYPRPSEHPSAAATAPASEPRGAEVAPPIDVHRRRPPPLVVAPAPATEGGPDGSRRPANEPTTEHASVRTTHAAADSPGTAAPSEGGPSRSSPRPSAHVADDNSRAATMETAAARVHGDDGRTGRDRRIVGWDGRVMTAWELDHRRPTEAQTGRDGVRHRFELHQARLNARFRFTDRLRAKISADLADALGSTEQLSYLRDAWANLRVVRAFQLRAGRLRRPFSRLENRGVSKLPFRGRGLFNQLAIEELSWGDRAVGAMAWGKLSWVDLKWKLMASNPAPGNPGVDLSARVQVEPLDWLAMGANGGIKRTENAAGDPVDGGAAGGDLRFRAGRVYATLEFGAAQDWSYDVKGDDNLDALPWMLGAVGYVNVDIPVGREWVLQPVVFAEWADSHHVYSQSEALRVIGGFNVLWTEYLRVLPQVELVRPVGHASRYNRWAARETYYLLVSLQM
ncbi:MAG: hypothetical protein B7733_01065 [Myxococcales bacterium FL481]|nr:MAG: hypothetical protein B7733_01065 [Myxococcales bacterium FL481]